MIPPFDSTTGYLPAGPHAAAWQEIVEQFGWNERRRELLAGLETALSDLRAVGGRTFYLNGSFVTAKEEPGDFDLAYVTFEVEKAVLEAAYPLLFGDSTELAAVRWAHYQGDILPAIRAGSETGWTSSRRTARAQQRATSCCSFQRIRCHD